MWKFYESWTVRVFNREQYECRSYLSPNRRDFFKILIITKATGLFTTGLNTYYIDHLRFFLLVRVISLPGKIFRREKPAATICCFEKKLSMSNRVLKIAIDKYALFSDNTRKVIRRSNERSDVICDLFEKMKDEELAAQRYNEEAIQAYLQLVMLEVSRYAHFPTLDAVNEKYRHVHAFFNLLEQETASTQANLYTPFRFFLLILMINSEGSISNFILNDLEK